MQIKKKGSVSWPSEWLFVSAPTVPSVSVCTSVQLRTALPVRSSLNSLVVYRLMRLAPIPKSIKSQYVGLLHWLWCCARQDRIHILCSVYTVSFFSTCRSARYITSHLPADIALYRTAPLHTFTLCRYSSIFRYTTFLSHWLRISKNLHAFHGVEYWGKSLWRLTFCLSTWA